MELFVRVDELIKKQVKNRQGDEFEVYQLDADGYVIDLQLMNGAREKIDKYINDEQGSVILKCRLTSRCYQYNGRTIWSPQAQFVEFMLPTGVYFDEFGIDTD